VIPYEVHLGTEADVLGERKISAAPNSVEACPVAFEPGGSEPCDDDLLEGVGCMWYGSLAEGAE